MQFGISIFREVCNPRDGNSRHALGDVLLVAFAATLCGAKSCVEIAEFADGNEETLKEFVPLAHGASSQDTFSQVFRLLDPAELERALAAFRARSGRRSGCRDGAGWWRSTARR